MKNLLTFEKFDIKGNITDIISEINDMCLELNDEYVHTECEHHPQRGSNREFISFGLEKMDTEDYSDVLTWNQVSDTVMRIIEFLIYQGWKLSYIIVDGESHSDVKDVLYNMNIMDEYSFYGLTLHFIKI